MIIKYKDGCVCDDATMDCYETFDDGNAIASVVHSILGFCQMRIDNGELDVIYNSEDNVDLVKTVGIESIVLDVGDTDIHNGDYSNRKWEDVVPKSEWLFWGEARNTLSQKELEFIKMAEHYRFYANKYHDALRKVCRLLCVDENESEKYTYGNTPIKGRHNRVLQEIMELLDVKEGDPEYLLWENKSPEN